MQKLLFVWDSAKNDANLRKHGIRFEDAAQVFADPLHQVIIDHGAHGEQRWHAIRQARGCILILVVHTRWEEEADDVEIIRIISARRADRRERRLYDQ